MPNLRPISKQQYQVNFSSGVDSSASKGYWNKCTPSGFTRSTFEYNDGQTGITREGTGFIKFKRATLEKTYNPVDDNDLIDFIMTHATKEGKPFNIGVLAVKSDVEGTPYEGSKMLTLLNCEIVDFDPPDVDRDATEASVLKVELIVGDITRQ